MKKASTKPKVKNIPNKKFRNTWQQSNNINLKKKDYKSLINANKQAAPTKDPLKNPMLQKLKSNKTKKAKGGGNNNKVVLAEILSLL